MGRIESEQIERLTADLAAMTHDRDALRADRARVTAEREALRDDHDVLRRAFDRVCLALGGPGDMSIADQGEECESVVTRLRAMARSAIRLAEATQSGLARERERADAAERALAEYREAVTREMHLAMDETLHRASERGREYDLLLRAETAERERDEARELQRRDEAARGEVEGRAKALAADLARVSDELGLPPAIGPEPGWLRRQMDGYSEALAERDALRRALVRGESGMGRTRWSAGRLAGHLRATGDSEAGDAVERAARLACRSPSVPC